MAMWLVLLILIPVISSVLALAVSSNKLRPWIMPLSGAIHLAIVTQSWTRTGLPRLAIGWS